MAKKSRNYWRRRFEQLEEAQHNRSIFYYEDLRKAYIETMNDIEVDILKWYNRFAANNEITFDEAKLLLKSDELREFRWTVDEYIEYGKKNALNQQWMKQLENASSRVHISRLESLQLQLQQHVEKLYGGQIEGFEQLMKETYQTQYYHTAFEVQKAFEIGFTLQALDETRLTKVISKPWTADGRTFSQKIWRDRNVLLDTLHKELIQSIARGEAPTRMISAITRKMNTSRSNAARLVMTESAFFSAVAQKDVFGELDVERYEIIATLDHKTSSICQSMDGKVFKVTDFEAGVTANPFHPRCRTTTAPYFADEFDISERAARDADGKVYYVPSDMKYHEWKERFILNDKSVISKRKILDESNERHRKVYPVKQSNVNWRNYLNVNQVGSDLLNEIHSELNGFMNTKRKEKMYLINKEKNSIEASLVGSDINRVDLTKEINDVLEKSPQNSIIFTHVHPSPTSFSSHDLFLMVKYKSVAAYTLECANGDKYILDRGNYKSSMFKNIFFANEYDKIKRQVAKSFPELDDPQKIYEVWDSFIYEVNKKFAEKNNMIFKKVE
ncbi:phage head morphogenesis protein [Lysinibacillus mangiferihumi]|uniref:Phage head morphogenesis protein n=1 Tax=Lysinibacillus mangiferihumi TaxID=1130819 RepID=A0A4U2Z1W5_9BACI|nr:minor capsid protein [Lysinibacillus mangiferihumi]TKI66631.1 phage head morphogenesis protein [Lysinibacillus mangiferihumi]